MNMHTTPSEVPAFDPVAFGEKRDRFEREYDAEATAKLREGLGTRFTPDVEITMDEIQRDYGYYRQLLVDNPELEQFVERYIGDLQPYLQGPFPLPGGQVNQGPWVGHYKIDHFITCGVTAETVAGKRVLDIGSNAGFDTFYLSTLGPREIIGIEPTPLFYYQSLLLWAVYNCPNLDFRRVGWQQAQETGLGRFDLVNCQGVLYHEPNPMQLVDTLFNLLTPGGTLVLETHVTLDDDTKALFIEKPFWGDNSWFWVPSAATACAMLRVYGFEEIVIRSEFRMPSQNPDDAAHTVEGNPVGGRAFITAQRPLTPSIHRPKFGWSKA